MRPIALILLFLLPCAAQAAKVKPPSAVLREATTSIAAVEFAEAGTPGRMVFRRVEKLGGDAEMPELIDMTVPASLNKIVLPGERYLVAYSVFRREAQQIRVAAGGAQLLVTPGLEPALLRDSPANRALLAWQAGADEAASRKHLPDLLDLLQDADTQRQNFALAEIVLRPSLYGALDSSARKRLLRFAGDDNADTNARARLLQAAMMLPQHFGKAEWPTLAQQLLERMPVAVQEKDGWASLARFAFELVERDQHKLPPALLVRWVASDNAALSEKALLALRAQDPKQENAALEQALQLSLLPAGTREFLLDHRRRQQLQAQR